MYLSEFPNINVHQSNTFNSKVRQMALLLKLEPFSTGDHKVSYYPKDTLNKSVFVTYRNILGYDEDTLSSEQVELRFYGKSKGVGYALVLRPSELSDSDKRLALNSETQYSRNIEVKSEWLLPYQWAVVKLWMELAENHFTFSKDIDDVPNWDEILPLLHEFDIVSILEVIREFRLQIDSRQFEEYLELERMSAKQIEDEIRATNSKLKALKKHKEENMRPVVLDKFKQDKDLQAIVNYFNVCLDGKESEDTPELVFDALADVLFGQGVYRKHKQRIQKFYK